MKRKLFAILTALMWLVLPFIGLRYAQVWDQLPARMATHFNASGQANGWMPRATALYFGLGFAIFMLLIFTVIALVLRKQKADPDASWFALLGFFYFMAGFIFYVNNSIIDHNLTGNPVTVAPLILALPLAIVLFVAIYMRAQRGKALPAGQILAEETHNSKGFSILFLALATIEFGVAFSIPATGVRAPMTLIGALFLLIAAHTWNGFHYRFTAAGLEISTLGLRLRSIPQSQIAKYRLEKWMALRGYGIRGLGNTRAYVWSNNVVHITTLEGEVYLGTNDPGRTVRDLDLMKQYAHS